MGLPPLRSCWLVETGPAAPACRPGAEVTCGPCGAAGRGAGGSRVCDDAEVVGLADPRPRPAAQSAYYSADVSKLNCLSAVGSSVRRDASRTSIPTIRP